MRYLGRRFFGAFGILCLAATFVFADAKVEQELLGPEGDSLGGSVSLHGNHAAVLAPKGSRFNVLIDGVAGPKIEALLNNVSGSPVGGTYWMGQIPVVFSNDGAHSAYIGKIGDEFVVFYDGKELTRGPIRSPGQNNLGLTFSNKGKHFFYMDQDDASGYRVVADGKPGPASSMPMPLILSPDGDHYVYTGFVHSLGSGVPNWAVVDGRQVNYFGENLQYNAKDSLISTVNDNGNVVLLLNGKPEMKAMNLSPMWMSPDGIQIAIEITPNSTTPRFLTVNGKQIADTLGLQVLNMYFSRDGKRWAALCQTKTGSKFMIIDGKKGDEYQDIPQSLGMNMTAHWVFATGNARLNDGRDAATLASLQPPVPGFTPDSSKFVYVATQGGRSFLIVDDQESDGFQSGETPALSASGNRIGYIGLAPNQMQHLIIDGKDQPLSPMNIAGSQRASGLTFSPGTAHYAFIYGQSYNLDGVIQPGIINAGNYVFSPDDKHFAYPAQVAGKGCFVMDGKVFTDNMFQINSAFFSPDSKHICFIKVRAIPGTKDTTELDVDGKMVTHYAANNGGLSPNFEFSPEGVLTFVARTDEKFVRFKITLPTDSNVDTVLAAAPQAK